MTDGCCSVSLMRKIDFLTIADNENSLVTKIKFQFSVFKCTLTAITREFFFKLQESVHFLCLLMQIIQKNK